MSNHLYWIKHNTHARGAKDATNKAVEDTNYVLQKMHFHDISANHYGNKALALLGLIARLISLRKKDILFFEIPDNKIRLSVVIKFHNLLKFKTIFFINDLNSIRDRGGVCLKDLIFDLRLLDNVDHIIVPNQGSKNILNRYYGVPQEKMFLQVVWDYVDEIDYSSDKYDENIGFAGNLHKSAFVKLLGKINVPFKLYGKKDFELKATNISYGGVMDPMELPKELCHCKWGLVWDGDQIDTCDDRYLKFNNSHKTSLYLASGIPVIVWKNAGLAYFVKQYKCGICLSSLEELNTLQMGKEKYEEIRHNAQQVAKKIRSGYFLEQAVKEALKF